MIVEFATDLRVDEAHIATLRSHVAAMGDLRRRGRARCKR